MIKNKTVRGGVAAILAAAALAGCARFEENEAGLRIGADGSIDEVVRGPELVCAVLCNPFAHSVIYKTFTDTFSIASGSGATASAEGGAETLQARQVFLRTKDDKFVENISLSISYEINPSASDEALREIYAEFRADSGSTAENARLIRDDLQILVTQPLVQAVRGVDAMDIQDRGDVLGAQIAQGLQAAVNQRLGVAEGETAPITIKSVTIGGVGFDNETEAVLRQKVLAAEQAAIAAVAETAAAAQASAAAAQAAVTGEAYEALADSVPQDQLSTAVCLDGVRQGRLPAGTVCFPGLVAPRQ